MEVKELVRLKNEKASDRKTLMRVRVYYSFCSCRRERLTQVFDQLREPKRDSLSVRLEAQNWGGKRE